MARDRNRRQIKTPARFAQADLTAYAFSIAESIDKEEPRTFQEACASKDKAHWLKAMKEEMSSLQRNNTWKVVDMTPGKKIIGCKWVFRRKKAFQELKV